MADYGRGAYTAALGTYRYRRRQVRRQMPARNVAVAGGAAQADQASSPERTCEPLAPWSTRSIGFGDSVRATAN